MMNRKTLILILLTVFFIVSLGSPVWSGLINQSAKEKNEKPAKTAQLKPQKVVKKPIKKPGKQAMKCEALKITTPAKLPSVKANTPYSKQLKTSGGRPPISYSRAFGSMPPGLKLSSKGRISGTPTKPGNYTMYIKATDNCQPKQEKQQRFTLAVAVDFHGQRPKRAGANPVIKSLLDAPLGVLKPLSELYVKGKFFGSKPGMILLYWNVKKTPAVLVDVNWKSHREVSGVVPEATRGLPNQKITIKVRTADGRMSNGKTIEFMGREQKTLRKEAVLVTHCGKDGNFNLCNHIRTGGECFDRKASKNLLRNLRKARAAVLGYHCNNSGAVGNDYGVDRYLIQLQNGWVFKDVEVVTYESSTDDNMEGPIPPFPKGKSEWTFEFGWLVTPGDAVWYGLVIVVEGPIGTHYQ